MSQLKQAEYPEQDEYSFWDFATRWARGTPDPNWRDVRDKRCEELASAYWLDEFMKGEKRKVLLTIQKGDRVSGGRETAWFFFPKGGPYAPRSVVDAQRVIRDERVGPWEALADLGFDDYPDGWFKRVYAPADVYRNWLRKRGEPAPAFLSSHSGLDYPTDLSDANRALSDKYYRVLSAAREWQIANRDLTDTRPLAEVLHRSFGNEWDLAEDTIAKIIDGRYPKAIDLKVPNLLTYTSHLSAQKVSATG